MLQYNNNNLIGINIMENFKENEILNSQILNQILNTEPLPEINTMNRWGNVTNDEIEAVLKKQVEINKINSLKETFNFIHSILEKQYKFSDKTDDTTYSQHEEEVIEAYQYYNPIYYSNKTNADITHHVASLILLNDKIEYHENDYALDNSSHEVAECKYNTLKI